MQNDPLQKLRLSSQFTMISKVLSLIMGPIVAGLIIYRTDYAIWGVLLGIATLALCFFFAKFTVNAYLENNEFMVEGLTEMKKKVSLESIQTFKKFYSRGHTYFYLSNQNEKFLIIAPMWGEGRKALYSLYDQFKSVKK